MQLIRFEGTMVREPEYRSGVSGNGFEWESVDLYVEENGVEKPQVFKFGSFGGLSKKIIDMGLKVGSVLEIVFKIESREGKGDFAGKYFVNLGLESVNYLRMNDGVDGGVVNVDSEVPVDDMFGEVGSFDINDDLPF